eukprot:TRINITY_DN1856_c0_g1_i1.p1 TRINITY_DN1856_c0_g1~~TRINITY_DN1856_c0_g1_i1.p1  ORF type:complete len:574 (-),score=146.87 TRINITY_DN1856_c0_g1_i1:457-2157(-)
MAEAETASAMECPCSTELECPSASGPEAWGFTREELDACVKVVHVLRERPQLFHEDPELKATELFKYINPRKEWKKQIKGLVVESKKEVRQEFKKKEQAKLAKTQLRQQRNAALESILAASDTLLLLDRPEAGGEGDGDAEAEGDAEEEAPTAPVAPAATNGGGDEEPPAKRKPKASSPEGTEELGEELHKPRQCHICKAYYTKLHFFYCSLCLECSQLNWKKRNQKADLTGKTVLLTGSRIKIGFQICLSLLRCGAQVIATTRFVADAEDRFKQEEDYNEWRHRLRIYRLDLRQLRVVQEFCNYLLGHYESLYAIINNAAQTVARPAEYYAHLVQRELEPPKSLPAPEAATRASDAPDVVDHEWQNNAPERVGAPGSTALLTDGSPSSRPPSAAPLYDMYDTWNTLRDRRAHNSWVAELAEVSGEEAAEVHAINALAPFIINSMLKPLLLRQPGKKYIVNVSAMEGQFYRFKNTTHPHTNMAKAALNMLTRTSAKDYARDNIFMNSVDTGWITDENPLHKQQLRAQHRLTTPLDEVDAAARVLDLVYTENETIGRFWKDYHIIPW